MRDERILEGTQKYILSGTQESLVWLQVPQAINSLEQVILSAGFKGLDKSFRSCRAVWPAGTGEGAGGGSGEDAENQGRSCPEVTNCCPAAGGPVIACSVHHGHLVMGSRLSLNLILYRE